MKSNHVPRVERLQQRVWKLEDRLENSRGHKRGNPYWYCKHCGIYDPQLYVPGGRHHKGCPIQGSHYKRLLEEARAKS